MVQKESLVCPFEHINNPELEAEKIDEITDRTVGLLNKRYPAPHKILRGVHPKSHGCVKATFQINSDLDESLQVGLFSSPGKKYEAFIRFSNAAAVLGPDIEDDGAHGSRGMAVKVFNVGDEALIEDDGACNQDFLMINQPEFAFANTKDYLRLTQILDRENDNPLSFFKALALNDSAKADFLEAENLNEEDFRRIKYTAKLVGEIKKTAVANPFNIQYFSAAPFLFGSDRVMKFSVKPIRTISPTELPKNPSADYLNSALTESMNQNELIEFDFMVQVRNDGNDMGIENASSLWVERQFPFIKVATIKIPTPQTDINSEEHKAYCEALAFTPWHSLAEHQPIGSINRLRKEVYQASAEHRNTDRNEFFLVKLFKMILKFFS